MNPYRFARPATRLGLALLLLAPLGLTSFVSVEREAPARTIFPGQPRPADPAVDARFRDPRHDLRRLLLEARANRHTNHFCLVAYVWPDGTSRAAVHWLEGQRLIPWAGRSVDAKTGATGRDDLLAAPYIDLTRDLVDTPLEQAGESYYHLRADAEGTLEDCRRHGVRYTIPPFREYAQAL